MRKLQVSLPDFRRLCIFKGIYPREPRNKKKASKSSTPSTTFYYSKDIQYLLHEPLLGKFRDHKALSKKIAKSLGRGDIGDAARLEKKGTIKLSLDHVIKERYPTFVDALRDLDDALSMLFLFANLPSTTTVPWKTIRLCQRLCYEFQLYVISSHSLRKSFLSIKGIYYQATIQGQDIMWLVPYKFVQQVTGDVDFRIMGTFIEFYTTLLSFVNFRLYSSIGLVYPPHFNTHSDENGAELGAFSLESVRIGDDVEKTKAVPAGQLPRSTPNVTERLKEIEQSQAGVTVLEEVKQDATAAQSEEQEPEAENAIDKFEVAGAGADVLLQPQIGSAEASNLFSSTHIFLSRESPRHALEFVLKAFGCKRVSWDRVLGGGAFSQTEEDSSITHQIVDRPSVPTTIDSESQEASRKGDPLSAKAAPGYRFPGRIYVQPQWVWDCVNAGRLLQPDLYAPGAVLPPHLSPWVKPKAGVYDPTIPLTDQESKEEEEDVQEHREMTNNSVPGKAIVTPAELAHEDHKNIGDEVLSSRGEVYTTETATNHHDGDMGNENESTNDLEFAGFDEEENVVNVNVYQAELEAEAAGFQYSQKSSKVGDHGIVSHEKPDASSLSRKGNPKRRQKEAELERRLGMATRKNRKLYEKMMHGRQLQDQEAANLRHKRRRIEREP